MLVGITAARADLLLDAEQVSTFVLLTEAKTPKFLFRQFVLTPCRLMNAGVASDEVTTVSANDFKSLGRQVSARPTLDVRAASHFRGPLFSMSNSLSLPSCHFA